MNKLILYSVLILSFDMLLGQTKIQQIESDTCSPSFQDVYNFNIGDVFQYLTTSKMDGGGTALTEESTIKYTIINKSIQGDTLSYIINGIKKADYYCGQDLSHIEWCNKPTETDIFQDTLIYIDSTDHFLNKCNQELVSNFGVDKVEWVNNTEEGPLYTKIQASTIDTNHVKIIDDPYYVYDTDTLVPYNNLYMLVSLKEVFAENLGLIELHHYVAHNNSYSNILQGYVKNGNTTGIINSDEELLTSIRHPLNRNDISIYPNPSDGYIYLNLKDILPNKVKIELFDMRGKIISTQYISDNYLDINYLDRGVYFLKIIIEDNISTKKIIIK